MTTTGYERTIGTWQGKAIQVNDETHSVFVNGRSLGLNHRDDFRADFLRWVERRVDWTVPSREATR